ncbi:hypothetical protein [Nocardia asiatica]
MLGKSGAARDRTEPVPPIVAAAKRLADARDAARQGSISPESHRAVERRLELDRQDIVPLPKSDSGISPRPALTTPVQLSTPPKGRRLHIDAGTAIGEIVSGFIEGLLEFFLGRR